MLLIVRINWAWDYFLYERAVRLITATPSAAAVRTPRVGRSDPGSLVIGGSPTEE